MLGASAATARPQCECHHEQDCRSDVRFREEFVGNARLFKSSAPSVAFDSKMATIFTWIYVIVAVLLLFGAAIFVHEWGHYIVALKRGLKVEEFAIGMVKRHQF